MPLRREPPVAAPTRTRIAGNAKRKTRNARNRLPRSARHRPINAVPSPSRRQSGNRKRQYEISGLGRRLTPTHTNKKGVRYSYYVSQAMLRKHAPGTLGRVPASELEAMVVNALCRLLQGDGTDPKPIPETDRELIERHLRRVMLSANGVMLYLRQDVAGTEPA